MSAKATQTDDERLNDRPGIHQFNTNTVWADRYIEYKDFDLADHVIRRAIVDISRDPDGELDGRVVYDDPRDPGIIV